MNMHKANLTLSASQREVLVGIILGDACLVRNNPSARYYLRIEQSIAHEEYVHHLYDVFNEWARQPPRTRIRVESREKYAGREYGKCGFDSKSLSLLDSYSQWFYHNCKKRVPANISNLLTARGLAYWYMDDGSLKSKESKAFMFNTQGFPKEDVEVLIEMLQTKFGLQAKPRKQEDGYGYQIYVSGRSYERFVELVAEHIIPSMMYKIPSPRRRRT